MAVQRFANNASALLAASISAIDTTIQVASGFGALFPSPGAGEFMVIALQDAAGNLELVKISSRSGDNLTVASSGRGQEGTTAAAWTLNVTRVELRLTRDTMTRFIQQEAGVVQIDLTIPNLTVSGVFTGNTVTANTVTANTSTVGGVSVRDASILNAGTVAVARLGTGSLNANTFLAGDGVFKNVNFTQLSGSIANAQVPEAAVRQHEAALLITGSRVTAGIQADNVTANQLPNSVVQLSNVSQHAASIKTRNLPSVSGTNVTVQSDPGGTPSGSPGDLFYYY